jgi:hypothetical protein
MLYRKFSTFMEQPVHVIFFFFFDAVYCEMQLAYRRPITCVIISVQCKLHGRTNEDNEEQVAYEQLLCKLCPFIAQTRTTVNIFQHDLFLCLCLLITHSVQILLQGQNGDS